MRTLVALDLETTGLDPERDAIIEIGAIRFSGARVEDEWSTLVNPGRPIPPLISRLTGISDDMVASAPRITKVLGELEAFVGDLPILGHNVKFDLSFLQAQGLFRWNQALDTYDLASVLMPSAGRYGLSALASALRIPVARSHRALDDAITTHRVLMRLLEHVESLPVELLQEIVELGADVEWGAGFLFEEALKVRQTEAAPAAADRWRWQPKPLTQDLEVEPLAPCAEPQPLDVEEVASLLEPGGPIAQRFPGYEHRPQQIAMLRAVAQALSEGRHLLVEAGTGTGKSIAYLIPALAWAARNDERIVVSTNTLNLQDQLIHKDIPDLQAALGQEIRASVLKGRANYLCPRRLEAMRHLGARSAEEMRVLAKVLVWLHEGGSGDRNEINLIGPAEAAIWSRLSAEGEGCSSEACARYAQGACPYYQARRAAERSHVVIVNHALLLADIATGNRVLPEYRYLIVDEAHHLESATTNGLSFRVAQADVERLLRDLQSGSGSLLARALRLAKAELPPDFVGPIKRAAEGIADRAETCRELNVRLFGAITGFLERRREGRPLGPYGQQERIRPSTRTLPEWSEIEVAWEDLRGPLATMAKGLSELGGELDELALGGLQAAEDLAVAVRGLGRGLEEIFNHLEQILFEPDPGMIYWAQARSGRASPSLHAAPLEVGPLVERYIWHEKEAVIMTSATLTTAGEFDYIRRRLNADDAEELALGSPFDFEDATLLYLVSDIPEPSAGKAYQRALERGLVNMCLASHGRALVLFTSYDHLRRTSRAIGPALTSKGILVYEQGEGASRHALLETFRSADQAVLLGTRSFWEGVDVPGEALSVLAIVRLPFDVPSDPIIAARAETYESPFDEYSLPEAILRFRQGFGRLIRSRSDRGVAVIFDSRVLNKRYGRAFIDSLPRCTVRLAPLSDLAEATQRWLGT